MSSTTIWKIETGHSQIQFKVKHLAITNVNGIFKTFEGTVTRTGEDFDKAMIKVSIASESIDTQNPDRDKHLKSDFLFDTDNYPVIIFEGELEKHEEAYVLNGNLTIRDVKRPITLQAKFTGSGKGFAGDERAGFEANGKMSRKDFDLSWNIAGADGGLVIGDEIKLHFDIQLVQV